MTNANLKNKVIAQLIKWGNNKKDVIKMVELHFDYAAKNYSSVKTISASIRIIY
jgi:hypothetical protein